MDTTDDHALAARIAGDCAVALMALRDRTTPDEAPTLGRRGDRVSHDLMMQALEEARPHDAVRSEEGADRPGRGPASAPGGGPSRLWVVDPLDGTREYAEGRGDFAVHVALVVGGTPVVGAVALPAEGLVFRTGVPPALAAPPPAAGAIRMAVSRTRPPHEARRVAGRLGAELVAMGSAGVKVMAVVRGTADVYLHGGGQYEWDSAAPVAVARAHGLHASRLDGGPLLYGRPDPWLPDLLVCRPELVAAVTAALRG